VLLAADTEEMRRPLSVIVLLLSWLPLVALAGFAAYAISWKVPIAFAALFAVFLYRGRRSRGRVAGPGRVRTIAEVILFGLLGATFGGFLFGAFGVLIGFVLGFTMRLAEVPVVRSRHS